MNLGFWEEIRKKGVIAGLAPMDGVTDVAYRQIQKLSGNPDVMFTEFIPVEGIVRLKLDLLIDFWYLPEQRPLVAQIYGNDPELMYASTQLVCELGFDGVDINMGCPAKSVIHRGCGAALIETPDLALELIEASKQAVQDWVKHGVNWQNWPIVDNAEELFQQFMANSIEKEIYKQTGTTPRKEIPVSVKTRTGFREPVTESWVEKLLTVKPAVITIHGRTLKQMYRGQADWAEISKAVELRDRLNSKTLILGNGDIKTSEDFHKQIENTKVDGILIGRGSFGNPWLFESIRNKSDEEFHPTLDQVFEIMLSHAKVHQRYKTERKFVQIRKNLAWYINSVSGAAKLREQLVQVDSIAEIEEILTNYKENNLLN